MFKGRLTALRKGKKMTQTELGQRIGVAQSTVASWENGAREPNITRIRQIAAIFGVSTDYLLGSGGDGFECVDTNAEIIGFHVIGEIKAGYSGLAEEYGTGDMLPVPKFYLRGNSPERFFVLRVTGNSMYPTFVPGDMVLVKRGAEIESGQIGVVLYNHEEATLKRVRFDASRRWIELVPINPEYMPRRIAGPDLEQVTILGTVEAMFRTQF